jgi:hypothetical protein
MSDFDTRALNAVVCVAAIIAVVIVTLYSVHNVSETRRIQSCVVNGGSWTDITPNDNYADMGCKK